MLARDKAPPLTSVCFSADLALVAAEAILSQQRERLPDFSRLAIFVPHAHSKARLMRLLLNGAKKYAFEIIIPPFIGTLRDFIEQQTVTTKPILTAEQARLTLVDELKRHHAVFPNASPWTLADALLELFDELTLNEVTIPQAYDDFVTTLEHGYGCQQKKLSGLGIEAKTVHLLWTAWQQQLNDMQVHDSNSAFVQQLMENAGTNSLDYAYFVGITQCIPAEVGWMHTLFTRSRAHLFLQTQATTGVGQAPIKNLLNRLQLDLPATTAENSFSNWLDQVFAVGVDFFAQRARRCASDFPESPVKNRLTLYRAHSFETEARAIDLQIRRWLKEKKTHIAVVIENRTLARRVRALLERSHIPLHDSSGWALSTTAAASVIESWLQAIEEDFAFAPLLSALKSPFSRPGREHLPAVYHLEIDIMQFENIARGMQRYKNAAINRRQRLEIETSRVSAQLLELLNDVERAAAPLIAVCDAQQRRAVEYIEACCASLKMLGIVEGFNDDEAGLEVLQLLDHLAANVRTMPSLFTWTEFRAWLGQAVEARRFIPTQARSPQKIELVTMAHCALDKFDALVIGGMTRDILPGFPPRTPFFNNAVRHELGLPANSHFAERFYRFRILLEAAPVILMTHQHDSAESVASPWLELLNNFHRLGYGDELLDTTLQAWASQAESEVTTLQDDIPGTATAPNPTLPPAMLPQRLSASGHQRLIDCPYAFFSGVGLKLDAPEEIREAMAKHDYGERVHTCLQAFHHGKQNLPGPFPLPLNADTKPQAIAYLEDITRLVFQQDIEKNFHHRGWMQTWLDRIPAYIDWQINHLREGWQVRAVEHTARRTLDNTLTLYGRIDRIDQHADGLQVIDYKTGKTPKVTDVRSGEKIQLPHYALALDDKAVSAEYIDLQSDKVGSKCAIEGEDFTTLTQEVESRLVEMWRELHTGARLPAWGDDKICRYCAFDGLCRKESWDTQNQTAAR